ncbi:MAG: hypothetical protein ACFFCP_08480 [Promethearchaeota archaeon]
MSIREQEIARIEKLFAKYLNGPLGNCVMDHLKEGESFTIKSFDEFLEIQKIHGKAVVRIVDSSTQIGQDNKDPLQNIH